jgi:hypothetical protein
MSQPRNDRQGHRFGQSLKKIINFRLSAGATGGGDGLSF